LRDVDRVPDVWTGNRKKNSSVSLNPHPVGLPEFERNKMKHINQLSREEIKRLGVAVLRSWLFCWCCTSCRRCRYHYCDHTMATDAATVASAFWLQSSALLQSSSSVRSVTGQGGGTTSPILRGFMASILQTDLLELVNQWEERVAFNEGYRKQKFQCFKCRS